LYPNQFVNARLQVYTRQNAITIPAAAVQRGAQGTYAYVLKQDQTVESRQIKVALTEGLVAVIDSGVNPGEQVVTDGQEKLQPGSRVDAQVPGQPGPSSPSARPAGAGRRAGH